MCFEERIQQMLSIHESIKKRKSGTYGDMAERFRMSKSNVFRIIECLRGFGAIIVFDHGLNSWIYKNDFDINFEIKR